MSITHRSLLFHRVHMETQQQEAQHCPQEVLLADARIRPPDLFVIIWSVFVHVWNKFRSGAGEWPITIKPSAGLWVGGEAGQEKCLKEAFSMFTSESSYWSVPRDASSHQVGKYQRFHHAGPVGWSRSVPNGTLPFLATHGVNDQTGRCLKLFSDCPKV